MIFIPLSKLKANMRIAEDVLVFERSNVRLLKHGSVLTEEYIEGLRRFGVKGIYIRDAITGNLQPSTPVLDSKTKEATIKDLEWIYNASVDAGGHENHILNIDRTVANLIAAIREKGENGINISDLKAYDEYTYHHSLSVTVIAIGLGLKMGLSDSEVRRLGISAILHDIGKMSIPHEIINKPGRLTPEEFSLVKQHSSFSGEYLDKNSLDDPEIRLSILSHHEKVDGTGYPNGLKGDEIPFYAKIISVADVYDALTSHRPYRLPEVPGIAAELIMGGCGSSFDMDVVRAFVKEMEMYPVGSFVELNNGKVAVVVDNRESQLRPVIRMIEPPHETIDLLHDKSTYTTVITKLYEETPYAVLERLGLK